MSRVILFRGKRSDNGEWAYGFFGIFKGSPQIFVPFTDEEKMLLDGHIFSQIGGVWHKVKYSTVGQYTGVTDKRGKKIFEGDIIKTSIYYDIGCYPHEKSETREVKYIDGCFVPLYSNKRENTEVIGNIYDDQ